MSCSRIPIVLGVTGHRNLHPDAVAPLRDAIRGIFRELKGKFRHTPLALLSPLAEGADRLAAAIALEENVLLLVPLPWAMPVCPEHIHRSGDRAEFEGLLAKASLQIGMPLVGAVTGQDLRGAEAHRKTHYDQVGAYVARHSQILIALWDGKASPDSSTYQVIGWQRDGKGAPFAPQSGLLDQPEPGPVYQIKTRRVGDPAHSDGVTRDYPEGRSAEYFDTLWGSLNRYNADVGAATGAELTNSRNWLLPPEKQTQLTGALASLFAYYAHADEGARRFQGVTDRTSLLLFGLIAGAVVCLELYAHLLSDWWPLLLAYVVLLSIAGLLHHRSRTQGFQERYLDYRALAEALRVQLFWTMAGLTDGVADHYLRHFRSELDWIRQAVRTCVLVSGAHDSPGGGGDGASPGQDVRLAWVEEHWVEDQRGFFKKRGPSKHDDHERIEAWSKWAFRLAVAAAVMLLLVHLHTHHMNHALAVAVFLLAVAAAMLHEWGEKSAYLIDSQRYSWMESLFRTAAGRLHAARAAGNVAEARELVKELGKEALSENADWVIQHRQRPMAPPSAG